jgi:hypothetical protein
MEKSVCRKDGESRKRLPWLPQFDRLLIAGIKHGPATKKDVINRILHLAPQWTRGDCWQRIRLTFAVTTSNLAGGGHSDVEVFSKLARANPETNE